MIKLLLLATAVASAPTDPIEEIADQSELPYLNPDLSDRKTLKIRLANGLEALIVSDPQADQSSAAIAVEAGSWQDPQEYPGMAHFCEHMVFMGSHTYPSENEFSKLVSDYNGQTNAFTSSDRTVYMFASQTEGFLTILDRFSHFFIDPLFNPSGISRELHAVDQEFAKNLEHDGWREHMIFKELGNPHHPNSGFNIGNSETLKGIPQSALKAWHQKHYGANAMHLVIYSPLPLDTLKMRVFEFFSQVPTSENPVSPLASRVTSDKQRGHIAYIKPVKNRNILSLVWELPKELSDDKAQAAELLAYVLGRGQKHSLYEKLKAEQLIDTMSVRIDDLGGKENCFFRMTLELTRKGIQDMKTAVLRCYEALATYRSTGIPAYLHHEKNALAKLSYQYQSRQDAFQFAMKNGESLPDEPLSTFPRNQVLAEEYNPEKIAQLASLLTPESCIYSLLAPPQLTGVQPDRKEKWLGAEYALRPIPPDWLEVWNHAEPTAAIRLPDPNPFVPNKLSAAPDFPQAATPLKIAENKYGIAYYCRVPEYQTPEAVAHLNILSPQLTADARSSCFASIYLDHLTDLLSPTLTAAQSAGLTTRFDLEPLQLRVEVAGFSEKVPLLLQEILKQMPLDPPTREQFDTYMARHEKDYLNSQKELAVRQGKELLDSLLIFGKTTKMQKLAELKTITYEEFLDYFKKLFEKSYTQAIFGGNMSLKEAESSWLDIQHILTRAPFPKEEHQKRKVLSLPEQNGPFLITKSIEAQGNAAILLIDQGLFTFETRAAQEILSNALYESFFDTLRTKQKTGYIASSNATAIEARLFQYFFVQSNSHQPEDLLYRFELFLETFNEEMDSSITPERFETIRQAMIHSLKTRFRSLRDKMNLWEMLAFEQEGNFQFIEERIAGLENLEYDRFLALSKHFLERKNRKRLAILCEGKLHAPFTYELIAPEQIPTIAKYTAKREL
ncbi:MAG: insulinase family protein [Verrucomicrobia bacterium]|nr:insulinase family protein [Verrucomicrobiota bacterium]